MNKRDYIEFQARTSPLGYLITFRTYGTWLHGDERGSMDRGFHNRFGTPKIKPSQGLVTCETELLKYPPVIFNPEQRQTVEDAINEVCAVRGYYLHAVNPRTNHVHTVVSGSGKPEYIMKSFKSYATRKLRERELIAIEVDPWSRHGSTRWLWSEDEIAQAVEYVLYEQDGDEFEKWVSDRAMANE